MVKESRIIFNLGDLVRFEVVCDQCGKGISLPMDSCSFPKRKCIHCDALMEGEAWQRTQEIIRRIRCFQVDSSDKVSGMLRLEIKDETS